MGFPRIIQGGMGAGVSNWRLARAVAAEGQLGVVSGVAMEIIVARRLQTGDEGGHVRHALSAFPDQSVADRIVRTYFAEPGQERGTLRLPRPHRIGDPDDLLQETVAGTFAEVYLAREGQDRPVGINLLTKMELPTLAALFGAMLLLAVVHTYSVVEHASHAETNNSTGLRRKCARWRAFNVQS